MEGVGERYARDIETGKAYAVSRDMTYKQWKASQDEKYGAEAVDKSSKMRYNRSADEAQYQRYKELMDADFPSTFAEFQNLKYQNIELWDSYKVLAKSKNYLQQQLNYIWNGEKLFIPRHTKFDKIVTIAGEGAKDPIRCVERLISEYGGTVKDWQKRAGKISSSKYIFDVHWYEKDGIQYEPKLKDRRERK